MGGEYIGIGDFERMLLVGIVFDVVFVLFYYYEGEKRNLFY